MEIILAIPIVLLVVALVLQPIAQRRRERAIWEQMKNARNATDAKIAVDCAIQSNKQNTKLPEKWYDSYRFWLK